MGRSWSGRRTTRAALPVHNIATPSTVGHIQFIRALTDHEEHSMTANTRRQISAALLVFVALLLIAAIGAKLGVWPKFISLRDAGIVGVLVATVAGTLRRRARRMDEQAG